MIVLITRPLAEARRTALRLRESGFEPMIAPLLEIVPVVPVWPSTPPEALLATSMHAFLTPLPIEWQNLPLLTVGDQTAVAAHHAGAVISANGDARALVELARRQGFKHFAYLAGHTRKAELERCIAEFAVIETLEVYHARAVEALPETARQALQAHATGAVLHYSRRSAEIFIKCVNKAGLMASLPNYRHLCLSDDVAVPLRALELAVEVAPEPKESSLLARLNHQDICAAKTLPYKRPEQEDAMTSTENHPPMPKDEHSAHEIAAHEIAAEKTEAQIIEPHAAQDHVAQDHAPDAVHETLQQPLHESVAETIIEPLAAAEPAVQLAPVMTAPVKSGSGKLGAGLVGGLVGALVSAGVYIGGPQLGPLMPASVTSLLPKPAADPVLDAKFAALDTQIKATDGALKALPKPAPAPDLSKFDYSDRLKALEANVAALKLAPATMNTAPATVAAPVAASASADVGALDARIASLEAALAAPKAQTRVSTEPDALAKTPDALAKTNAPALAIIAEVLNQDIAREVPFANALTAAESLGVDVAKLASLKAFADKGLPTNRALSEALAQATPAMLVAVQPPASANFSDRMWSSLSSLVKIRTGAVPAGDDPASLIERMAALAAKASWRDVLALQAKLPQVARDKSEAFAKLAQSRLTAEDAAQSLLNDAMNTLAKPKN